MDKIETNLPDAPKGKESQKTEVTPAKKTKGTEHKPTGLAGPTKVARERVAPGSVEAENIIIPRTTESPLRGVRKMRRGR